MSKEKKTEGLRVTEKFLRENWNEVVEAAREGRLVILPVAKKMPGRKEVVNNVRAYVSQIDGLARPEWEGRMDDVWEAILNETALVDMLMPGKKARKCREFNKYTVMRIVGVMRSCGVYDKSVNDYDLSWALEHTRRDSTYRPFIGMGLKSHEIMRVLENVIKQVNECQ